MLVVDPDWVMLPVPETTCPPMGAACARGAKASRIAVASALRLSAGFFLRVLVEFAAVVPHVLCAVLKTRYLS